MKFINKYLLKYLIITLLATIVAYFIILVINRNGSNQATLFLYLSILAISAYRIGKKDDYRKFYGLNYHLTAYVVYNSIPLLLIAFNLIPDDMINYMLNVIIVWGIILFLHFALWMVTKLYHYRTYKQQQYCK